MAATGLRTILRGGCLSAFHIVLLFTAASWRPAWAQQYLITTVAGTGFSGYSGDGSPASGAWLNDPTGVAVDGAGNLLVADKNNERIRKINVATGIITTLAGTGSTDFFGDGGPATKAAFYGPFSLALDAAGNLFIADTSNHRIRKINAATGIITTVAGTGVPGFSGDGGQATNARLNEPTGVAVDSTGNLFVADYRNSRIRKVDAATGIISTVAGTGTAGFSGDGGPATSAQLYYAACVVVDATGNLYVADAPNNRIRKVGADGNITTVAGTGKSGFSGDGGPATSAQLSFPEGVALDGAGNIYIADVNNSRIRRVAADGTISTVAGSGTPAYSGDGGPATSAQLNFPVGVVVDASGHIYVADALNHRIRLLVSPGIQPLLGVSKSHAGSFAPGQAGATYTITVNNTASSPPTSGSVTVSENLPAGLTLTSMSGSGWTCTGASCTRNDVLSPGSSYPPITVTVNVAARVLSQVINGVTVSGGGAPAWGTTATDRTDVVVPQISAVLNGASYTGNLSPGCWAAIFGVSLAPSLASAPSVPLPTQLNGVSVTVGGLPAPLYFVSPGQINALIPFEAAAKLSPVPVVVKTPYGTTSPVNVQLVSRDAPALFTENGSGTGKALVFDSSFRPPATVGQAPIILYAAGLGPTNPPAASAGGGASAEPFNRAVDAVDVYVGDRKANVLFAGLAPGFPGIYQLNLQPNGAMTDRIYLRQGGWQSNTAQVSVASGTNVANATGFIAGLYPKTDNLPASYNALAGSAAGVSVLPLAAVFNVSFDIPPNAQPFDVVAASEGGTAVIHFDTQQGVYTATLTVPSAAARQGDFSSTEFQQVLDFVSCGGSQGCQPLPGNIVPASRFDPAQVRAISFLPMPNVASSQSANATFSTTGSFAPGTKFVIDANNHPELAVFAGFLQIAYAGVQPRKTTFGLYVDGKPIATKDASYSVVQ